MSASHPLPLRGVLFDLDGTLLDTAPDLGAAVNHVLISEGFAPLSDEIIRQTTSHGALGLLKAGLGDELLEELGATRLRNALLDYYAANLCVGTRPYVGMVDLIEWLDEKQLPWGIVTNKPGFLTEPLLAALPQLASCGVTVSADTLPVRKPDPAPMFFACEKLGSRRLTASMWGIMCGISKRAAMLACAPRSLAGAISMMRKIPPCGAPICSLIPCRPCTTGCAMS